jgi:ribosome-associated toxin RatA of RatAB toxin-antitoxin module
MREITRSALVPYTPQQMFALVEDVEKYPQFLPWCLGAQIIERTAQQIIASLELGKGGMREKFTTRNVLSPPDGMQLHLIDGPFKTLEGVWSFDAIQERGARISLTMRFEFANPLTALLLSKSFEKSLNSLVDAFTARAQAIYGTPPASV